MDSPVAEVSEEESEEEGLARTEGSHYRHHCHL